MGMDDLDKPYRPRKVWQAMKDGFNANEIAHMWSVSVVVALGMMNRAVPRARRIKGALRKTA